MEPLYKNINNTNQYYNRIPSKNSKKQEFEAAYLKEINVISNNNPYLICKKDKNL
jgi:hypothetical protein